MSLGPEAILKAVAMLTDVSRKSVSAGGLFLIGKGCPVSFRLCFIFAYLTTAGSCGLPVSSAVALSTDADLADVTD